MTPSSCLVLFTPLLPTAMKWDAKRQGPTCVQVGADVAGRFQQLTPDLGVDQAFSLTRSRFEVGLTDNGAGARVVWGGVRSGGQDSYIGVAGESIVPQLQVAEAQYASRKLGATLAMGLVDDAWVVTGNNAWDLRAVAPGVGEDQGWLERSDLGATLAWTSPGAWATVALTGTSGEGLSRRERNAGQDTSALLVVRPLSSVGDPELLTLQGWRRDGSRGLGSAPNHRSAARITHRSTWAAGGAEWLKAEGVGGDGARSPTATSVYAQVTPPMVPAIAYLRRDKVDEVPDVDNTDRETFFAGAGVELPVDHEGRAPARLLVGWQRTVTDAAVRTLAGAGAEAERSAIFIQLDFRGRATLDGVRLTPIP